MGFPLSKTLDDILEEEVSEDYFIAQERVDELIHRIRLGKTGMYPDILETSLISSALGSREHRASGWKSICGTLCARDYKDPKVVAIPIKASKDTIHNVGGLNNKNSQSAQVFSPTGVSPTLTVTQPPKILQRFDLVKVGDLICKHDQRARVYSSNGIAPTVMTVHPPKILQKYDTNSDNVLYRIRRLTPLECWILLGFTLEDYNKVRYHSPSTSLEILKKYPKRKKYITSDNITLVERTSKSNLYKQAGNSIGVPVTRMLARQLRDSLRNYIQC